MNVTVDLETQDRRVREFFESMSCGSAGATIKLNGSRTFLLVEKDSAKSDVGGEWTTEKNNRRSDLIDRKVEGTITDPESIELAQLQYEMGRWLDRVAPRPLKEARELHAELVKVALLAQPNAPK